MLGVGSVGSLEMMESFGGFLVHGDGVLNLNCIQNKFYITMTIYNFEKKLDVIFVMTFI